MTDNVYVNSQDSSGLLGFSLMKHQDSDSHTSEGMAIDKKMVNAVYQEILKMMQNQPSTSTSQPSPLDYQSFINFAGTVSAFSVNFSQTHSQYKNSWIIDTRESDHKAYTLHTFDNTHKLSHPLCTALLDGTPKSVDTIGFVIFTPYITLNNVFYVPEFNHNLLSVGRL